MRQNAFLDLPDAFPNAFAGERRQKNVASIDLLCASSWSLLRAWEKKKCVHSFFSCLFLFWIPLVLIFLPRIFFLCLSVSFFFLSLSPSLSLSDKATEIHGRTGKWNLLPFFFSLSQLTSAVGENEIFSPLLFLCPVGNIHCSFVLPWWWPCIHSRSSLCGRTYAKECVTFVRKIKLWVWSKGFTIRRDSLWSKKNIFPVAIFLWKANYLALQGKLFLIPLPNK